MIVKRPGNGNPHMLLSSGTYPNWRSTLGVSSSLGGCHGTGQGGPSSPTSGGHRGPGSGRLVVITVSEHSSCYPGYVPGVRMALAGCRSAVSCVQPRLCARSRHGRDSCSLGVSVVGGALQAESSPPCPATGNCFCSPLDESIIHCRRLLVQRRSTRYLRRSPSPPSFILVLPSGVVTLRVQGRLQSNIPLQDQNYKASFPLDSNGKIRTNRPARMNSAPLV